MIKRNLWKIILSIAVVIFFATSLTPLKDREFIDFAQSQVTAKQADFNALVKEAVSRSAPAGNEYKTAYVALRDIAKDRNINLNDFFGFTVTPGTIENMNNDVLKELLRNSKARLQMGLDLKGGVAFTLELDPKATASLSDSDRAEKLKKANEIINRRVNIFGVTEPIIRTVSNTRLEVQLPGVSTKDNPEVIQNLQKPALLGFHKVYNPALGGTPPPDYQPMQLVREDGRSDTYYVKRRPEANGSIMAKAGVYGDQYGKPQISLSFTSEGRQRFYEMTKSIVEEHARDFPNSDPNYHPGMLAIVLDGELQSSPTVREPIDSPQAQITGNFSLKAAQDLAAVLNNPLDVPMVVQSQYEVGPSLAEYAVDSGVRSALIGALLVAAFMIVFYTSGGLLAVVMLAVNIVIIFGVMGNIGATLTLPGLAGIVLTVGMAVDANILIFERMREELAVGKTLSAANQAGFKKALWTILDAHFVQLLICGVMIIVGKTTNTAAIQGFGTTLAIGVCSTLFSVLITGHMILELLADSGFLKRIKMHHLLRHAPHWDFVKYGKYAFICSWAIVVIGVAGAVINWGQIKGIDFKGGYAVELAYTQRVDIAKVQQAVATMGVGEFQANYVREIGGAVEHLSIETTTKANAENIVPKLNELFPVKNTAANTAAPQPNFTVFGSTEIGASMGQETFYHVITAIVIAMLVTLLYIAFRFEFGFGVGAMFSSLHDILMVIGLFVIIGHFGLGFQFSAPMVAAILAIAGYSINETVVVFDRIREELRINQGGTLKDIVNTAINKVFARTIMTSTTTLLAALSLFIWGSGTLKEIAFTFLVGIITSTFSAIFISSQVFYWYHRGDRKRVEKHQDVKPTYEWTGASKASE